MTTFYKLTDESGQTYNHTQWGVGVEHTTSGNGNICSSGWIHAYTHPLIAVLLNPIHANFKRPRLWQVEGDAGITDRGMKVGTARCKIISEIPLPEVNVKQKIRFGILCAQRVYKNPQFLQWSKRWLNGLDRSGAAAWIAREAVNKTLKTAEAAEAAEVAYVVAHAATSWALPLTWTTDERSEELVAMLIALAVEAAVWATEAVGATDMDLISLAEEAMLSD